MKTPTERYERVPLDKIEPSPTNPRKSFDAEELEGLAQSIREQGVMQPILVRPVGQRFEIVYGERRFRASKIAGAHDIPARIVDIDDCEVLQQQIIENDQRSDITDLERSDGYQALIDVHELTIADIVHKTGKSETTIRGLLKLQGLPVKSRVALAEAKIESGVAQLIATRPKSLRANLEKFALTVQETWDPETQTEKKGLPTVRDCKSYIRQNLMVVLEKAPFDQAESVPGFPVCQTCPNRTGNNKEEYADARADVCVLPTCFEGKVKAWNEKILGHAKAMGQKLFAKPEVAKLFPYGSHLRSADWIDLANECYEIQTSKKWKALLTPHLLPEQIALAMENGTLHQLVARKTALDLLAKHHHYKPAAANKTAVDSAYAKQNAKRRKEAKVRRDAAMVANCMVAEKAEHVFAMLSGKSLEPLRALVIALADCLWNDACHWVAKRRELEGDVREAVRELAAGLQTNQELLGLAAELVASRLSFEWGTEHFQERGAEDPFWKAWGIDPKALRTREKQLAEKPTKTPPKVRSGRPDPQPRRA